MCGREEDESRHMFNRVPIHSTQSVTSVPEASEGHRLSLLGGTLFLLQGLTSMGRGEGRVSLSGALSNSCGGKRGGSEAVNSKTESQQSKSVIVDFLFHQISGRPSQTQSKQPSGSICLAVICEPWVMMCVTEQYVISGLSQCQGQGDIWHLLLEHVVMMVSMSACKSVCARKPEADCNINDKKSH